MQHYGYYMFLGLGDFPQPEAFDDRWTSRWERSRWQEAISNLKNLGSNTLFLYLMGHRLPYPSRYFPECVEMEHPNVRADFLQDIIDRCHAESIGVVAVFSTTGHARSFAMANPRLAIADRGGRPMPQYGIVCHHHPDACAYPLTAIRECLNRYRGFKGVVLHPPEFVHPCFCDACRNDFSRKSGRELRDADEEVAQLHFMQTYMEYQRTVLETELRSLLPNAMQLTFTIPWIFEKSFEQFAAQITTDTVIVDWDYNLDDDRMHALPARLMRYGQFGHRVWFMPTAGYDFSPKAPVREQSNRVLRQIALAKNAGIQDIIYFLGPYWYPSIEEASWHCRRAGTKPNLDIRENS